jgi:hypothetical protein
MRSVEGTDTGSDTDTDTSSYTDTDDLIQLEADIAREMGISRGGSRRPETSVGYAWAACLALVASLSFAR